MLNKKYFKIINKNNFNFNLISDKNINYYNDNNKKLFIKLNNYKKLINEIDIFNWNKFKSYTYNYEYVYNVKSEFTLVKYKPISRSYFKICEIILDNIKLKNEKMSFCFLAESPGGFIDYIINSRKHLFFTDDYYTISLISDSNLIPNFKSLNNKYKNINILLGKDKTGDICKLENIIYLKQHLNIDFVTADGGFDFTDNYENQENNIYNLIFCEIICALSILNKNGYFILKVFDLYSTQSMDLIYLLSLYFEKIQITKPYISKPANSEKYIICYNFKGISENELLFFYNLIKNKKKLNLKLPDNYIDFLTNINVYYTILQINTILHTILLFKLKISNIYKMFINFKQFIFSILWCIKYNQSINYNIYFFKIKYKSKIDKLLFYQ